MFVLFLGVIFGSRFGRLLEAYLGCIDIKNLNFVWEVLQKPLFHEVFAKIDTNPETHKNRPRNLGQKVI